MKYVASLSCGKDSLAMVLRLMEENRPLDFCVMYDTEMEFKSIYNNLEKVKPVLEKYGCQTVVLKPDTSFLYDMLIRPVNQGKPTEHYGYDWCGGCARWRTAQKTGAINAFLTGLGDYYQYVGIAYDEPKRIGYRNGKTYPLVEWKMTERDCLEYCYSHGWNWNEATPKTESGYIDLYSILDRVSCWCCCNKNLKELRNIYHYLPDYWAMLKGMQSRIDRPFRRDGKTIFDLEERFKQEDAQLSIDDIINKEMQL